jgi:hypothetical protein
LGTQHECQIGPVIDAKDLRIRLGYASQSLTDPQTVADAKVPISQLDHCGARSTRRTEPLRTIEYT